jgi:hypothetical protein
MALRFRKTFKLAPGIRLGFSNSGPSLSLGPRGASIGIGKRGVYANAGIPGTGLSARQRLSGGSARQPAPSRGGQTVAMDVDVVLRDDGELAITDRSGNPLPDAILKMAKQQAGDQIRSMIQAEVDRINNELEAVSKLHRYTPAPWETPTYEAIPFPLPPPEEPVPKSVGLLAKLLGHRAAIESANNRAASAYMAELDEWNAARAAFEAEERVRRSFIEGGLKEISRFSEFLEAHLGDIAWPRETEIATATSEDGALLVIEIDLPEIEDMPNKRAGIPARGMRMAVKDLKPGDISKLYLEHVHSLVFRIVGEAFAALPSVQEVVVSGFSQRPDKSTGAIRSDYLISSRVRRSAWEEIDFSEQGLERLDPVEAFARFETVRQLARSGAMGAISPLQAN